MHHDIRHSIKGAIISGAIGFAILSAILYLVDKKINWLLMIGWFAVFTIAISFFYKYYFLHSVKVAEKKEENVVVLRKRKGRKSSKKDSP